MKASLDRLDKMQAQINSEKDKYKEAIQSNKKLEDVKVIYLRIKTLEKEANELMEHVNQLHKG